MEFYQPDSNLGSSTYIRFTGRALGFPDTEDGLPASTVTNVLENTRNIHAKTDSTHVPSMLLDVERGQPIEVEVILGEVVRMAKERDVDIPVSIAIADNVPID
jgi:hypothetical protein